MLQSILSSLLLHLTETDTCKPELFRDLNSLGSNLNVTFILKSPRDLSFSQNTFEGAD